ncbi:hypothetical protein MVEN_00038100 [Mycena venus]|uniref:Uncharacterized protein n=1 Tax=Mycena venus TaxID=2733690 RepID=A0A8H7DDU1_9AGAR|nr:hypothetical protein MVEN_00038100 [Mycena venus]
MGKAESSVWMDFHTPADPSTPELWLALRLSLAEAQLAHTGPSHRLSPSPPPGPPLRPPSQISQAGRLWSLSLSPDLPDNLLSMSSTAATREPSPGISASQPTPLRITTQINEIWMQTGGGPTIHGSWVATKASKTSTTFHIKKSRSKVSKRFMVVYWDQDRQPHRIFDVDTFLL